MKLSDIHEMCRLSVESYHNNSNTDDRITKFFETRAYGIGFEAGALAMIDHLCKMNLDNLRNELEEYIKESNLNSKEYDQY